MSGAVLCPVCAGSETPLFLERDAVPVHQNLVLGTLDAALRVTRGDLRLHACADCGFVFNSAFDGGKLSYGADYDNTQSHSPYFARYMADLAARMVHEEGVRDARIVEVGCGKGVFLRMLVEDESNGNSGVGFDPSYMGPDTDAEGRLRFERRFYDEECAGVPADAVVCRHVIEHVPQPMQLLRSVRRALANARSPRIFFETPCVEWILRNRVIWDFFYEHCSLFSAASLRTAFESAGFEVRKVEHVFGGQYLWLEAGLAASAGGSPRDAHGMPRLGREFAAAEAELLAAWRDRIEDLSRAGRIAIWGAGAKGTTFAHLLDPRREIIDCLVDLNPAKQGKFVPGTGHAIVGFEALGPRGVKSAILMNPNYRAENEALLARAGIAVQLVE